MYVVTVEFDVLSQHYGDFMSAMLANAAASLANEVACTQFDVCEVIPAGTKVFLYEVYDDANAFDLHLKSPHFLEFNTLTKDWVSGKKVVIYQRATALGIE